MEKKNITLPLSKIASPQFVPALNALLNIALPSSRDTYALARTLDLLEPELKAHATAMNKLIMKHGGKSNLAEVRSKIEACQKALPNVTEEKEKSDLETMLQSLKTEERKTLLAEGESYKLTADSPKWDDFVKERDELEKEKVTLFLDHKVRLPETNLPLTAIQIRGADRPGGNLK